MTLDDVYEDLRDIAAHAGTLIRVPIEAEVYFSSIVSAFQGSREELLQYVAENIDVWFPRISNFPEWLQEPEWQFNNGHPMIFVGQLDIPKTAGYLHDDGILFLFWDPDMSTTKTVLQVS